MYKRKRKESRNDKRKTSNKYYIRWCCLAYGFRIEFLAEWSILKNSWTRRYLFVIDLKVCCSKNECLRWSTVCKVHLDWRVNWLGKKIFYQERTCARSDQVDIIMDACLIDNKFLLIDNVRILMLFNIDRSDARKWVLLSENLISWILIRQGAWSQSDTYIERDLIQWNSTAGSEKERDQIKFGRVYEKMNLNLLIIK